MAHQIKVTINIRTKRGKRYRRLRWKNQDGTPGEISLGRVEEMTAEAAELAREQTESRLRLGMNAKRQQEQSSKPQTVEWLLIAYIDEWATPDLSYRHQEVVRIGRMLGTIGDVPLTDLRQYHLAEHLREWSKQDNGKGGTYKRRTLVDDLSTLRRAWKAGQERKAITLDLPPMPPAKTLRNDARPKRRLTEANVAQLVQAARTEPGRNRQHLGNPSLLTFSSWSGWRPKAVRLLRLCDVERLLNPALARADQLIYCQDDKGGTARGWRPVTEAARLAVVERVDEMMRLPMLFENMARAVGGNKNRRRWAEERAERARERLKPEGLLWVTTHGGPVTSGTEANYIADYSHAAGLQDVQWYDLRRHACMQILSALNWDCEAGRLYTGHESVETLLRYVYVPAQKAEDQAGTIGWTVRAVEALKSEA